MHLPWVLLPGAQVVVMLPAACRAMYTACKFCLPQAPTSKCSLHRWRDMHGSCPLEYHCAVCRLASRLQAAEIKEPRVAVLDKGFRGFKQVRGPKAP